MDRAKFLGIIGLMSIDVLPCWAAFLTPELEKPYMQTLRDFLKERVAAGARMYPPSKEVFNVFKLTAFADVRVVIIGQDPYHGAGQAHGLAFSVRRSVPLPPSLKNIYQEIQNDLGVKMPSHGDLTAWAKQGVLLLNATLTVEEGRAGAHQKRGWEEFTDYVIRKINDEHEHVVFMLWGAYAQKKGAQIDRTRHFVLESVHPSPLSAHRGFFGCRHFSKANAYLKAQGRTPIAWECLD